jgi:hypothetical protein
LATHNDDLRHGETITPAQTALRRRAEPDSPATRKRRPPWVGPLVAFGVALVLWAVFVWLPQRVAQTTAAPTEPSASEAPEPQVPALSPEQAAELQARGETMLARILTQQESIEAVHPERWAAAEWTRYRERAREGDDAFLDQRYDLAVAAYEETLALGERMLERSTDLVADALAAAEQALIAGDWQHALSQYELVLGIDPEQAAALRGSERARRLPEVLARLEEGQGYERDHRWEEAVAAFRGALDVDAEWAPAREALERARTSLADARFESLLSEGYAALAAEDYAAASDVFERALALRPDARSAQEGLTQAQQGVVLNSIALAEVRAAAFESRELWDQAIAQYRAALETDATLAFAREGLARAEVRADLDIKLANLLENPNLLLRDGLLAEAERLLEQGRAVAEPGPRLQQQIAELDRLTRLAATPLRVTLRSDELTEVTLYRIGALGRFVEKTLDLRPGSYTAVGSRTGYRDVRATFTVLPGQDIEPVIVRCTEPI